MTMRKTFGNITLKLIMLVFAIFFVFGPISSLAIWSIAEEWFWPNAFPTEIGSAYWQRALSGNMMDSLMLSFKIAIIVTIICMIITIPVAYLISRRWVPFRNIILILFLLPQAFPQLPVYNNTMALMYRYNLVGTESGLILIHLCGAIVYSVWTMTSVFLSVNRNVEEAAYVLGASKIRTFFDIALPMAMPGVISSALLVFLFSLDEFTGSLLIGAPFKITMPVYMYNAANGYEMQIASVTALLLMIPGVILLLVFQRFMKSEYLSAFGR